ncbi:hypothetical protein F5888DRAFT_1604165, partial [Russula emetica]
EKLRDHQYAVAVGGAQGFFGALAVSLPVSYIANQRWPYYKNLPPSLKAFGVVMAVVPTFIIAGETAGRRYEQDNWERANRDQVKLIHRRSETGWENMTFSQKTVDFMARHQFSAIAGCWALGIAGAFGMIMRNPCVCDSSIVQARMWSQGITIGVVIAAASVTRTRMYRREMGDVGRVVTSGDHSWQEKVAGESESG